MIVPRLILGPCTPAESAALAGSWLLLERQTRSGWIDIVSSSTGPTVAVLFGRTDEDTIAAIESFGSVHRANPDAALVHIQRSKWSDRDRPRWLAALHDAGASLVVGPWMEGAAIASIIAGLLQHRTATLLPHDRPAIDLAASDAEVIA